MCINHENIFFADRAKKRKSFNHTHRDRLKKELSLRLAHNQFRINNIRETLKCFLNQKYRPEYDGLSEIIPKLNGFLIYSQQNTEDYTELTCPDEVLDLDVLKSLHYDHGVDVRLMSVEENFRYRELVEDDSPVREECNIPSKILLMEDEEKEKSLYKPYHDSDLNG